MKKCHFWVKYAVFIKNGNNFLKNSNFWYTLSNDHIQKVCKISEQYDQYSRRYDIFYSDPFWKSIILYRFCIDDPLIIETTIGLVLGPCTALCRLFLKHCTLTNKAVGTIWRALSKPPQRRQGPDLRPLWLLVGTPSAIRPELAFSRAEHSLPYSEVTIYIFAILYLSSMPYV